MLDSTDSGDRADSYLFVLSAADPERLRAYVGKVIGWLQASSADKRFADAIYTWQVGRTAMKRRLAIKVRDAQHLRDELQQWLADETRSRDASVDRSSPAEPDQQQVEQALAEKDWERLGVLWTSGADVAWRKLYAENAVRKPRCISVPTYPFARERHWIDILEPEEKDTVAPSQSAAAKASAPSATAVDYLFVTPVWEPVPAQKESGAENSTGIHRQRVVLCEMPEVDLHQLEPLLPSCEVEHLSLRQPRAETGERYIEHAVACLEKTRELLAGKLQGKLLFQLVIPDVPEPALLAGLAGLLKTAGEENPQFSGQIILTNAQGAPHELAQQLRDERSHPADSLIKYAEGVRHVLRWQPARANRMSGSRPDSLPATFKDDGVYLITGGMGGLGIVFAEEILRRAARPRIVLAGRSPLSGAKREALATLARQAVERGAASVEYRQVDIENRDEVRSLIVNLHRDYKQLNGILHGAGMLADRFILKKTADELRRVLAPKVRGTLHLDEATRDIDLDFLALFSSVAAVTGHAGQADYAAANGFLDQFAIWRNQLVASGKRQGHTLSINWPLWQDGGMAIDPTTLESLRQVTGMRPMRTSTGLRIFHESLALGCGRALVMEGDIEKLSATLARGTISALPAGAPPARRQPALAIDAERLHEATLKNLKQLFGEVIKRPPAQLDAQEELAVYGIDSIIINTLNYKLSQVFGELSKTLFFEYRTLKEVTGYLTRAYAAECMAWTGLQSQAGRSEEAAGPVPPLRSQTVSAPRDTGRHEPIAIIGISGIYPRAATLEALWDNLSAGRNCIGEIPPERWSLADFYTPDVEQALEQGKSYSKWGGFIDEFAQFDPLFFNISPREALNIDPQERLFLQECWRALEDAGYTRAELKDRFKQRVGVFAGITKPGFNLYATQPGRADKSFFPHTSFSSTANRVSYFLNVTGPSLPIDTMCSSSLTAIHEACETLHRGECELAFAGGVNLYLHPYTYTWLCSHQMLSRDGLCRSFGAGGNGYVPGEGVGVVLLKPLLSAIRDHDHIHGVILASHVNHGGKTHAYTVPNPKAQAELIRRTIDKAGIKATDISYIEAHGTGTELGDPIEISGLQQAFAEDTAATGFCKIGSVKSNIGHLEAAAGIAGLTKVLLQMKHRQLAPSLHATQLNPNIAFNKTAVCVNTHLSPWEPRAADGSELPRTSGISAFGAGGANAHLIVQEYPAPESATAAGSPDEPVVILLSARAPQQLQQRARDLLRFIQSAQSPVDLTAMAYTLQVGREAMEERLGCLVTSVEALAEKLRAYLAGEKDIENLYRSALEGGHADALSLLGGDEDFAATLDRWIDRRKLARLLEVWTRGVEVPWSRLYGDMRPRRMALPSYPFAQERYWVDAVERERPADPPAAHAAWLHPLVHRNTSVLSRQSYSSILTGEDFFLRDHQVHAERVLPAAAYLEMARAALDAALPAPADSSVLELHDTVWAQPMTVSGSRAVTIWLDPSAASDGESASAPDTRIDFEIRSFEVKPEDQAALRGVSAEHGPGTLHCQGLAVFSRAGSPPALDLARLAAQMRRGTVPAADLYDIFTAMGVQYGAAHRPISAVELGERELLARLRLPDAVASTRSDYVLHPSLLDGALQASIGLLDDAQRRPGQALLPFALDTLRVFSACAGEMIAWVRYSPECACVAGAAKFDIDLCDASGKVCAQLRGFTSRALERHAVVSREPAAPPEAAEEGEPRLHSLVPVWNRASRESLATVEVPASARVLLACSEPGPLGWVQKSFPNAQLLRLTPGSTVQSIQEALLERSFEHLLWIAPDVQDASEARACGARSLIEDQEQGVLAVFRLAKALLNLGYADKHLHWTLITRNTQSIGRQDRIAPAHAGVVGFVGSLAKEYREWNLALLDIDTLELVNASDCLSLRAHEQGDALALRRGEYFRQGLARVDCLPEALPAYRQNGVYVVIGGAGGIGAAWSRFMVEHYQARLVWIGRRPLDATLEDRLRSLGRAGHAPVYFSADATNRQALQQVYERILATYPTIHGVIHSALDLQDQSVALMEEATFRASLGAKVDVSVNMDEVFGALDLDFMLFFSSLIAFTKAPGQANYAAGCTFKDSFALSLARRRRYPVKIMNWGYWGNVGVVTDDFYKQRMRRQAIGSIEAPEAMDSLQTLVSSALPQLAVLKTLHDRALDGIALPETWVCLPEAGENVLPRAQAAFRAAFTSQSTAALQQDQLGADTLELATEILASSLASLGLLGSGASQRKAAIVEPSLRRWLSVSLDYLWRQECTVGALDDAWARWHSRKRQWLRNTHVRAHVELLEACLAALPDILTGRQPATDVMFPNSSLQRVEGLYRGHPLADYCNDVLGANLSACIRERVRTNPGGTVRILEIGAGTGGTTARILPLLQEYAGAIAEYCYTDLSKAFLIHAEEHYRPQLPALTTAIFDVTKPLHAQSIAMGRFDFVVATNVLHATPDIRETVRNAKALLKHQGVLLLNEMSTWSLFSHLTFGLLAGWWLYEDEPLRLPGSPGLRPRQWQEVLADEGFESIGFPAEEAHELGQQIIVASSDGRVRQRNTPRLEAVENAVPVSVAAEAAGAAPARMTVSAARSEQVLRDACIAYLQGVVARNLRMEPSRLEPGRPLAEYGLDSILVVGLTNQLRKVFPGLTSTLFFEVRNIAGLADYILENKREQLERVLQTNASSTTPAQLPAASRDAERTPERAALRGLRRGKAELAAPTSGASPASGIFDVAIVGLSGRYPQSPNLDALWRNLANGRNCVTEIPEDRWSWREHFDAEKGKAGKIYSKWGGFLEGIDRFDPLFFRISPKEAKVMDPQERLFLESCYHAIEDAGYTPESLGASEKIGVFVGVMNARYSSQPLYYSIANRVSFLFDFQGPSLAVDTACSSSLTAIHLALESLYSGLTECAIAGGVNLIIDPVHYMELSALTMLSAGDQCRSFADGADGFVDAEGVGALVLKPLKKAEQDGDHIYGVIKASAINAGGRTNGYTVPNPKAQSAVIAKALERANVPAAHISYIEAHGTGTALGDPLEIAGLSRAFEISSEGKQFCAIGSLKSNIGHCESAAGIAGLTKVLLQLKHRQLVPSLHTDVINPEIDFSQTPFRIQKAVAPWLRPRRKVGAALEEIPRIAGISSFGAGGANAHIIVQEYEASVAKAVATTPATFIIPLSARTDEQLRRKASDLLDWLRAAQERAEPPDLGALAHTLQVGRESLEERAGFVVASITELVDRLAALSHGRENIAGLYRGRVKRHQETPPAFGTDPFDGQHAPSELVSLWVTGVKLDWNRLYAQGRPRRMSLPPYPFARERYWRDRAETFPAPLKAGAAAVLHPLLQRNVSDLHQQSYRSTFTGEEWFLTDQQVLPAMAHLEMARAAVESATAARAGSSGERVALELFNVVWADPVVVTSSMQIAIALFARGSEQIDYEIYSPDEGAGETVHCQGQSFLCRQAEPARIDVAQLRSQLRQRAGTEFSGSACPLVTALYVGPGQLLAELNLAGAVAGASGNSQDEFVLHPHLMDNALQAACALIPHASPASFPLALESLRILSPCRREMVVWARHSQEGRSEHANVQLDIDLCDRQGHVCIQMRGVTYEAGSQGDGARRDPFPRVALQPAGVALSAPQSQAFARGRSTKPTQVSLSTGE